MPAMRKPLLIRRRRILLSAVVLLTLAFSALIPAGFMPATDGSLSLQVCHSGLPDVPDSHSPAEHHAHDHFCPFGALPGTAPVAQGVVFQHAPLAHRGVVAELALPARDARREPAHPSTGPPALI
jgi:hypothetical protein